MDKAIKKIIKETLAVKEKSPINESYVTRARKYDLPTELLSEKTKKAHQESMAGYVESLNEISAKLDTVSRDDADSNHSSIRGLKIDETYNANAAYLHALYFKNISDLKSVITMDSITFIRIERDFGSFDAWQKDFIATCLASRNGWGLLVYNIFLGRYMNVVVDLHSSGVPIACIPILAMDCWEHSYYRDYLRDRKTYIYAMMKEINWEVVEKRVRKAEKIAKIQEKG